jgi:hypothetical protein
MRVAAKVKLEGIKPILINSFPVDTFDENKSKSGSIGKNETEWKKTILMDAKRNIYVLPSYITACISGGGKHIKVGKATLSKKVSASLQCMEDIILLDGAIVPEERDLTRLTTDPVYLDVRSVVNPMTKGRNLRYRIAVRTGWKMTFTIMWDDFAVSKDGMKNCIENAGIFEGIGDGRKIGFGRFKLLSFSSIDVE